MRKYSEETINKMRLSHLGTKRSEEAKQKTSESLRARWQDRNSGFNQIERSKKLSLANRGRKLTDEQKRNISQALKGREVWNTGKKLSETHIKHLSESHKGNRQSEAAKRKISKTTLGVLRIKREARFCICGCGKSFDCKINSKQKFVHGHNPTSPNPHKMRLVAIKRIELNNGQCLPNYNKQACEFFKSFDELHNTRGQYAMYGGGEYFIEKLGYWVDYFNPNLKLIIEWDEPRHFDIDGKLKPKDIIRQQEIQKLYPDYEFKRIRE